jgi:hypothetical protein
MEKWVNSSPGSRRHILEGLILELQLFKNSNPPPPLPKNKTCKNIVTLYHVRYTQAPNHRTVMANPKLNYFKSYFSVIKQKRTANPTLQCPVLDCSVVLTRSTCNSQLCVLLAYLSLSAVIVGNVWLGFLVSLFPLIFSYYLYVILASTLECVNPRETKFTEANNTAQHRSNILYSSPNFSPSVSRIALLVYAGNMREKFEYLYKVTTWETYTSTST